MYIYIYIYIPSAQAQRKHIASAERERERESTSVTEGLGGRRCAFDGPIISIIYSVYQKSQTTYFIKNQKQNL